MRQVILAIGHCVHGRFRLNTHTVLAKSCSRRLSLMLHTLTRSALSRPLVLLFLIAISYSVAIAQRQPDGDFVQLIPQPRQIALKSDRFQLSSNDRIVLADPRSEDDRFAATDFVN